MEQVRQVSLQVPFFGGGGGVGGGGNVNVNVSNRSFNNHFPELRILTSPVSHILQPLQN
jgi:hypothetical protein